MEPLGSHATFDSVSDRRGHSLPVQQEPAPGPPDPGFAQQQLRYQRDRRTAYAQVTPRECRTSLRLPRNDLALELLQQRRRDQPEDADGHDAAEHDVDLQELPGVPDQIADARFG